MPAVHRRLVASRRPHVLRVGRSTGASRRLTHRQAARPAAASRSPTPPGGSRSTAAGPCAEGVLNRVVRTRPTVHTADRRRGAWAVVIAGMEAGLEWRPANAIGQSSWIAASPLRHMRSASRTATMTALHPLTRSAMPVSAPAPARRAAVALLPSPSSPRRCWAGVAAAMTRTPKRRAVNRSSTPPCNPICARWWRHRHAAFRGRCRDRSSPRRRSLLDRRSTRTLSWRPCTPVATTPAWPTDQFRGAALVSAECHGYLPHRLGDQGLHRGEAILQLRRGKLSTADAIRASPLATDGGDPCRRWLRHLSISVDHLLTHRSGLPDHALSDPTGKPCSPTRRTAGRAPNNWPWRWHSARRCLRRAPTIGTATQGTSCWADDQALHETRVWGLRSGNFCNCRRWGSWRIRSVDPVPPAGRARTRI